MILYRLKCTHDHEFEAWFRDSGDFDAQAAQGAVECPLCGDHAVTKTLMTPRLGAKKADPAEAGRMAAKVREQMNTLHRHVVENADYVGTDFPEEARRIHYKEAEERGIYGEASPEEVKALNEEGVEVFPLPGAPEKQN